jgi:hypothetical protein
VLRCLRAAARISRSPSDFFLTVADRALPSLLSESQSLYPPSKRTGAAEPPRDKKPGAYIFVCARSLGEEITASVARRYDLLYLINPLCARGLIFSTESNGFHQSSPARKNIPLSPSGKSSLQARPIPFRTEGRWPSSRTLGWDAVDAAASGA